jgi:predicted nucleotidyltransferase
VALTVVQMIDRIRRTLSQGPGLRLAILFGSAARGRAGPDSDIDVGILPSDPDLTLHAELDLQSRLERACGRPVDLVRLDTAGSLLRWEAARHGIPIFARSHADLVRFVARAAIEYADLAPALARASDLFRQRLIEGCTASSAR